MKKDLIILIWINLIKNLIVIYFLIEINIIILVIINLIEIIKDLIYLIKLEIKRLQRRIQRLINYWLFLIEINWLLKR